MASGCVTLTITETKGVLDSLDKYVAISFFVALILTITIVLLVTKYVQYNMSKEQERLVLVEARGIKRLPREEEDDESDSEFHFETSDEESEEISIPMHKVEEPEDMTPLETNYTTYNISKDDVRIDTIDMNNMKEIGQIVKLLYQSLESKCECDSSVTVDHDVKPKHDLVNNFLLYNDVLATSTEREICQCISGKGRLNVCNYLLYDCTLPFTTLLQLLKNTRTDLLTCLVDFLLRSCQSKYILSQDQHQHLLSVVDQRITDVENNTSANDLDMSVALVEIVNQFEKIVIDKLAADDTGDSDYQSEPLDGTDMSRKDILQMKIKKHCSGLKDHYCKVQLSLIKLLNNKLDITSTNSSKQQLQVMSCVSEFGLSVEIMRLRIHFIRKYVSNHLSNRMMDKRQELFTKYQTDLSESLMSLNSRFCHQMQNLSELLQHSRNERLLAFANYKINEIDAVKTKILFGSKKIADSKKLDAFCDFLCDINFDHFTQWMDLQVSLTEEDLFEVATLLSQVTKSGLSDISKCEEALFSTLLQEGNLSEDDILQIAEQVKNELKKAKLSLSSRCEQNMMEHSQLIIRKSKYLQVFIEVIVKLISSHYRTSLTSSEECLRSLAFLDESDSDRMITTMKQVLSNNAFDLTLVFSNHFHHLFKYLICIPYRVQKSDNFFSSPIPLENFFSTLCTLLTNGFDKLEQPILQEFCEPTDSRHLYESFLYERISSLHTDYFHHTYNVFSSSIASHLHKEYTPILKQNIMDQMEKVIYLVETVKLVLKHGKHEDCKRQSEKHLSRAGSSTRDPLVYDRVEQTYESQLGMKMAKFANLTDNNGQKEKKQTEEKDSTMSPISESVHSLLSQQKQSIGDISLGINHLVNVMSKHSMLVDEYMVQKFTTKLKQFINAEDSSIKQNLDNEDKTFKASNVGKNLSKADSKTKGKLKFRKKSIAPSSNNIK